MSVEPWNANITTLVNFESKWKDMVDDSTQIPTPYDRYNTALIGAFEGGGYVEKGIYRPRYDCTMKSIRFNDFCPVCQRALREMLLFYTE